MVTLEGSPEGNLALLETQMLWLWVWNRCSHRGSFLSRRFPWVLPLSHLKTIW